MNLQEKEVQEKVVGDSKILLITLMPLVLHPQKLHPGRLLLLQRPMRMNGEPALLLKWLIMSIPLLRVRVLAGMIHTKHQ